MTKEAINFTKLSSELDSILESLDSGRLSIDDSIKQYEHGMEIVGRLETYLKEAENKVTKIKAKWGSASAEK